MSATARAEPAPSRILCLGEALVDLICEGPVDDLSEAPALVPHFGGVAANVAVVAARAGAPVALAGGAGDDSWGRWLRRRLEQEGVDVSLFRLLADRQTGVAVVSVDSSGEPSYTIYGETDGTVVEAVGGQLEQAVAESGAVFLTTNTLARADEREVSMRARELALRLGRSVVFDPNLRSHRWRSAADAAATANACVPGALLVRATLSEASTMTGENDPERAATALVKAGARMVVLTTPEGAMLRGAVRADLSAPPVPGEVRSTIGAGDVLTGFLLGRLALSGFYAPAVAAGLREAVARAAHACSRWGALE